MDLSTLSNEDLLALQSGDLSKLSNQGLLALNKTPPQLPVGEAVGDIPLAPPTPPKPKSTISGTLGNEALGAGETALTLGTGILGGTAGTIYGTLKQAAKEMKAGQFGTPEAADRIEQLANEYAQNLTYAPRTEEGKRNVGVVADIAEQLIPLAPMAGFLRPISETANILKPAAQAFEPAIVGKVRQPVGAAITGTGKAITKPVRVVGAALARRLNKDKAVTEALKDVTGEYAPNIIERLKNANELETAGQAAVGSGSTEFSALQKMAEEQRAPSAYDAIARAQQDARLAALKENIARTPEELAQAEAALKTASLKNYGKVESNLVDPRSNQQKIADAALLAQQKAEQNLASRNQALQNYGVLSTDAAQLLNAAKGAEPISGLVRQTTTRPGGYPEQIPVTPESQTQIISPRYPGEPRAPARYAPQMLRSQEAGQAAQEFKNIAKLKTEAANAMTGISENLLLNQVGETGPSLNQFLTKPSIKKAIKEAKRSAQEKGIYFPKKPGDQYSIANLQRIKRAVNEQINAVNPNKQLGPTQRAELINTAQSFTDFLRSKSKGFAEAEDAYAAAIKPIQRMKVGQALIDALNPRLGTKERATNFANALANSKKLIKNEIGQDIPIEEVLTPKQMSVVRELQAQLDRDQELKRQARLGTYSMNKKVGALYDRPEFKILDRTVLVLNSLIKRLEGKSSEKVLDRLTELMKPENRKELIKILEKANPQDKTVILADPTIAKILASQTGQSKQE